MKAGSELAPDVALGPPLWWHQTRVVIGMELGRAFGRRRALPTVGLAVLPAAAMMASGLFAGDATLATAKASFATVFSRLLLGACLFFGCALVFTQLFRGEILRQSLHFYFLSPLRREVLAVAKYAAGVLATWALFGGATIVSFLLIYLPAGSTWLVDDFASGPALAQLLAYLGTTMLGCLSYGALFLLFGVAFRNPILPAAALLGWEGLHFLLPAALQTASVRFHLKGLAPMPAVESTQLTDALGTGALATVPAAWGSVLTLLAVAAVALTAAAALLRRIEIDYGE